MLPGSWGKQPGGQVAFGEAGDLSSQITGFPQEMSQRWFRALVLLISA